MTDRLESVDLQPVAGVSITVLVDNISDLLAAGGPGIVRPPLVGGPTVDAGVFHSPDVVRAEHGFSALVAVHTSMGDRRILFDTGISPDGMTDNMRRLDVDPKDVESVVMSHGHLDHTGGLIGFVRAVGRPNLPLLIHPDFWLERRLAVPGRDPIELPTPSRRALEDGGYEVTEERRPSLLLADSILVTGEVHRTTDFETGFPVHQALRDGEWTPDPHIRDDQAIVLDVEGKGLVIITGCGHAGVVNITRQAQRLTGVDRVHAIIGGFHLTGGLFEKIIERTVDELAEIAPDIVFPGHCTGFRAQQAMASRLPDTYVHPTVGTRLELGSVG
jgi:7,8-dihydropterin-6-yl-methyl-4-(beta-D-ribofuranosyl)aminobenzene 5'-phosphate synthase